MTASKPLTCGNLAGDPASAPGQAKLSRLARKSLLAPRLARGGAAAAES